MDAITAANRRTKFAWAKYYEVANVWMDEWLLLFFVLLRIRVEITGFFSTGLLSLWWEVTRYILPSCTHPEMSIHSQYPQALCRLSEQQDPWDDRQGQWYHCQRCCCSYDNVVVLVERGFSFSFSFRIVLVSPKKGDCNINRLPQRNSIL